MSESVLLLSADNVSDDQVFSLVEELGGYLLKPPAQIDAYESDSCQEPPAYRKEGVIENGEGTIWIIPIKDPDAFPEERNDLSQRCNFETKYMIRITIGTADFERSSCSALIFCKAFVKLFPDSILYDEALYFRIFTSKELLNTCCNDYGVWV